MSNKTNITVENEEVEETMNKENSVEVISDELGLIPDSLVDLDTEDYDNYDDCELGNGVSSQIGVALGGFVAGMVAKDILNKYSGKRISNMKDNLAKRIELMKHKAELKKMHKQIIDDECQMYAEELGLISEEVEEIEPVEAEVVETKTEEKPVVEEKTEKKTTKKSKK